MAELILTEKFYSPDTHKNFEIREGAGTITLADVIEFAKREGIDPHYVDLNPDCDHYEGPEGPDKYLWISWRKDKVGK